MDPRHALGKRAEEAAASFLETSGFVVLARNLRMGRLELDLVVRKRELIAVVEVRTRSEGAWVRAMDSIDWRKRQRVRRAGERLWRARFQRDPSVERMRFDIVTVSFEAGLPTCEHVPAAF